MAYAYVKLFSVPFLTNSPAKEPTLRPAVAPASVCNAPREAIGFTEELLLDLGDEPAIKRRELKHKSLLAQHPSHYQFH